MPLAKDYLAKAKIEKIQLFLQLKLEAIKANSREM